MKIEHFSEFLVPFIVKIAFSKSHVEQTLILTSDLERSRKSTIAKYFSFFKIPLECPSKMQLKVKKEGKRVWLQVYN